MTRASKKPKAPAEKGRDDLWQGSHPSAWSFWKDGVSSSLLSLFLTCREQFRLSVVDGWKSRTEPLYFGFGTCGHWLLERAYQVRTGKCPDKTWLKHRLREYEKAWTASAKQPTAKQMEQQDMIYGLHECLMPSYFKRWSGDWGGKYPRPTKVANPKKWLALEQRFTVPFEFPDGRVVPIRGTRDGMYECGSRGMWVFDSKFRSVIIEDDILDTFPFDLQQMLYLWAAWRETGKVPSGAVLNVTRRPGHRLGKQELVSDFYDRVAAEVADRNRWDHYFMRFQLEITKGELQEWEDRTLRPLLLDLRGWWEGTVPHYLNPLNLVTKYGRCEMFLPITKDVYSQCYRRSDGVMDYQENLA